MRHLLGLCPEIGQKIGQERPVAHLQRPNRSLRLLLFLQQRLHFAAQQLGVVATSCWAFPDSSTTRPICDRRRWPHRAGRAWPFSPSHTGGKSKASRMSQPKYFIRRYRGTNANLRMQLLRIIKRADLSPWAEALSQSAGDAANGTYERVPRSLACAWWKNMQPACGDRNTRAAKRVTASVADPPWRRRGELGRPGR
jgi:hypothetical protein